MRIQEYIDLGKVSKEGSCPDFVWNECKFRLEENPTLSEFISFLQDGSEWGYVDYGDTWVPNNHMIEYRCWKIVSDYFTEKDKTRKIKLVSAKGGWGEMNYLIRFVDEQDEPSEADIETLNRVYDLMTEAHHLLGRPLIKFMLNGTNLDTWEMKSFRSLSDAMGHIKQAIDIREKRNDD